MTGSERRPVTRMSGYKSLCYQFWAAIAVVLGCSVILGALLISTHYRELRRTELSEAKLERFQLVMRALNHLSAERGPLNSVLGEEPTADSPSRRRLAMFRANTDAALDILVPFARFSTERAATVQALAKARRQADRLGELPLAARSPSDFHDVVLAMFGVVDTAQALVDTAIGDFDLAGADHLIGPALVARMLSDIREQVGRMGSNFVASIAARAPISPEQRTAHDIAYGRVLGFWDLVGAQTRASADPRIVAMQHAVAKDFFGDGMAIYRGILAAGHTGDYGFDTTTFTNRIVPKFASLEKLRDLYLDAALASVKADEAHARRLLTIICAITLTALLLELALVFASQKLLFRPLLSAREAIMALAQGRTALKHVPREARGEMGSLFRALDDLRDKLVERDALDHEKQKLTVHLRKQADTDGLTGVLNRGALERLAARLLTSGSAPENLRLILLDIDHFKRVNDRHGHSAGDEALKETARRLRAVLRPADVIARFGGEEFAILLFEPTSTPALLMAERLRHALQSQPFELGAGAVVNLTASFGVASVAGPGGDWRQLVQAADQALYRAKGAGRNQVVVSAAA